MVRQAGSSQPQPGNKPRHSKATEPLGSLGGDRRCWAGAASVPPLKTHDSPSGVPEVAANKGG